MTHDYLAVNRPFWDERAPLHVTSDYYDLDTFRRTRDCLRPFEIEEVGEVAGRRLLHLQCHIGTDTLSWARHGARVTGLDFSAESVKAAAELSAELGIDARFVTADVYDAVDALSGERFDIVYTGIGALCWLPDIYHWARVVARLLRPGGLLYVADFHPLTESLDDETGTRLAYDYFDPAPRVWDAPGSYAAREASTVHNKEMLFQHTLGDIVTAVSQAGLRVDRLREHDFTFFERFGSLRPNDQGLYRRPAEEPSSPLLFSLRALAD